MRTTLDQRVAPFNWRELEIDTEFYVLPRNIISQQMVAEYNAMLELLCPNGDYDDSYDHLPKWQAMRVDGHDKHYNTWDRRVSVKTKRNGKFISKTKENK